MIDVILKSESNTHPLDITSHAAKYCYSSIPPKWGKRMDVENHLFKTGHHTTMEHTYFTFAIEGISIADVTFGLHLTHPFYNTDQRSGRYCGKMYLNPDLSRIEGYIKKYWPEINEENLAETVNFVEKALKIYQDNLEEAVVLSEEFIKEERPFAKEDDIERNAPKIAQEQMRVFIPLILPTGLDYSIDLITLASMYRSSWNPVMRKVVQQMVDIVVEKYPEISFMFDKDKVNTNDWAPKLENEKTKVLSNPILRLLDIEGTDDFVMPKAQEKHPVDLLHFTPHLMNNNTGDVKIEIECSLANMGDDQRHRTVKRSEPTLTGDFYLYPIPLKLNLEEQAIELFNEWKVLAKKIPATLATVIAPYGAVAKYKKKASFNALAHEMAKRLCWCAHREIYHLGRELRHQIENKYGTDFPLLKLLESPCHSSICSEGARYCGRDLSKKDTDKDFYPERKV